MAAGVAGRLYVVGGYGPGSKPRNTAFAFHHGHWTPLQSMPAPRAAGGAAIVGGKLYVVGGVEAPGRLARDAFAFDFETARWTTFRDRGPREHLGTAALGGRVYVVAGRTGGLDTNQDIVEAFHPRSGRWRDSTGAGEARRHRCGGRRWPAAHGRRRGARRNDPKRVCLLTEHAALDATAQHATSRHGLGLVGWRGCAYALAGGPKPG